MNQQIVIERSPNGELKFATNYQIKDVCQTIGMLEIAKNIVLDMAKPKEDQGPAIVLADQLALNRINNGSH